MKKLSFLLITFLLMAWGDAVRAQVQFDYYPDTRLFVAFEGASVKSYAFPQKLVYQEHKAVDGRLAVSYHLQESGEQYIGLWDRQLQYIAEYNLGKLQVLDFALQEETEDASGLVMVRYFDPAHQTEFAGIFDAGMQWLGQYELTGATDIHLEMKGFNPAVYYRFKGQDWFVELASNGQVLTQMEASPTSSGAWATVKSWDGKQGMADAQGKIMIPCQFDEVFDSNQPSVYIAISGGKWGTVDYLGNKISGFSYDEIGFFHQGIAPARKGDKWGFVQFDGKELTGFVYDEAGEFEFGPAKALKDGQWQFIGTDGKVVNGLTFEQATDFDQNGTAVVKQNGKFALFNAQVQKLSGFEFDKIGRFPETGPALAKVQQNGKWGFIDTRGNVAVPATYDRVNDYRDGRAAVEKAGKQLFLDADGQPLATADYEKIRSFRSGVAQVSKGGKSTLIGLDGKELVPLDWDRIGFKAGYGVVWSGRKQGLIDKDGSVVIAPNYDMVDIVADKGNLVGFLVSQEGKRGVVNPATKDFSIPLEYEELYGMAEQGLFLAKDGGLSGLFTPDGKAIADIIYEQVKPINANLIAMKDKGGLWGVIDRRGNKVMGYSFEAIGEEMEGRILLKQNGKVGFADEKGQVVVPVQFEESRANGFSGGLYPTKVNGKPAFINKWGEVVE